MFCLFYPSQRKMSRFTEAKKRDRGKRDEFDALGTWDTRQVFIFKDLFCRFLSKIAKAIHTLEGGNINLVRYVGPRISQRFKLNNIFNVTV